MQKNTVRNLKSIINVKRFKGNLSIQIPLANQVNKLLVCNKSWKTC